MSFSDETVRALDSRAATAQIYGRVPGLAAGVARSGQLEWFRGIGTIDLASAQDVPDEDTQYAVASNSKTFTAVAIMALRDEGRLNLDDTAETHMSDSTHARVTIRRLLAHTSGMQREPVGDVFDTMVMPERDDLVAGWRRAERVGRPHDRWHYSNLGYAVLGEIIARLDACTWEESITRRILDPLEMTRTGTVSNGRRVAFHGRGPRPLGRLHRRSRRGGPLPGHPRGDVPTADHGRPHRVTERLGSGPAPRTPRRADLGRAHQRVAGLDHRRLHRTDLRHDRDGPDEQLGPRAPGSGGH